MKDRDAIERGKRAMKLIMDDPHNRSEDVLPNRRTSNETQV